MNSKGYNYDTAFKNTLHRSDLSDYLYHWGSGDNQDQVLNSLFSIIIDRKIYGSNRMIKGGFTCVSFTETPIEHFNFDTSRYWPLGICVKKLDIFNSGGRPVIYQPDVEYYTLPESLKWRHMRYEPNAEPSIDFSWEREWRIKESIDLDLNDIQIIVPNNEIATEIEQRFNHAEWNRYGWECVGYGEDLARYPEPLDYPIKILNAVFRKLQ